MIYQRLADAIRDAYRNSPEAEDQAAKAARFRAWLTSLDIDPVLRDPLVEQASAIEAAFVSASSPSKH